MVKGGRAGERGEENTGEDRVGFGWAGGGRWFVLAVGVVEVRGKECEGLRVEEWWVEGGFGSAFVEHDVAPEGFEDEVDGRYVEEAGGVDGWVGCVWRESER
jgi:hypothetical protein